MLVILRWSNNGRIHSHCPAHSFKKLKSTRASFAQHFCFRHLCTLPPELAELHPNKHLNIRVDTREQSLFHVAHLSHHQGELDLWIQNSLDF